MPTHPPPHLRLPLRGRVPALVLAALFTTAVARAQVYVGDDGAGAVLLSNHPSAATPVLLVGEEPPVVPAVAPKAVAPAAAVPAAHGGLMPLIRDAARRHLLPETLLTAVIATESGFDPRAVSSKGAKGLMQLMPDTARRFGVHDLFAAEDNLRGGAAYLRQLMDQFDNDLSLALAAFNAGEGAVLRAGRRVPDYPETRQYVARVLAYANRSAPADTSEPASGSPAPSVRGVPMVGRARRN